jgi:O-methyltransferase involved in polyketide biosynthesis
MEQRITLGGLSGIPRTLLLPLRGRYLETKRADGIIRDPKSVEIVESIEDDFAEADLPWDGQTMISVRTEILDELTRGFLARHPDSVVVNLGCGLDTRFQRVDNGRVTWYDLDLPEAIELRRNFFTESGRHIFISKSVFDLSWADLVPKNKRVLFRGGAGEEYFYGPQGAFSRL